MTYVHLRDGGVELVATTRDNMSPSFVLEFLKRIGTIIKDYCGQLSEEAIRKNFVLIYELLDEVRHTHTHTHTHTHARAHTYLLGLLMVCSHAGQTRRQHESARRLWMYQTSVCVCVCVCVCDR